MHTEEPRPRKPPTFSAAVVEKVISVTDFTNAELAAIVFKENTHPYHALQRVRRGESSLNLDQIGILQSVTGLTYAELLSEERVSKTPGGYRVSVDGLFAAIVTPSGAVTLTEYRDGAVRVLKTIVNVTGELTPEMLINKIKVAVL